MAAGAAALVVCALCTGCSGVGRGEALLRAGKPAEVLATVRPRGAEAYRLRARALRGLGRLVEAETELRISLALEPRSAEGHRLLGYVEGRLGNQGAALRHLERSLALDGSQQRVARAVARLLVRRALLRLDPAVGLQQPASAREELGRASRLDPALDREIAPLLARCGELLRRRAPSVAASGLPGCPGVPAEAAPIASTSARRCSLRRPERHLRRLARRFLLVGCAGARLAWALERRGCAASALATWRALRAEAPRDRRWVREIARLELAAGRLQRVGQLLTDYVFLAPDRAAAQLDGARMLIAAGHHRPGAGRAMDALALAEGLEQALEVVRVLARAGLGGEARAAARYITRARGRWSGVDAEVLARQVERSLATPGRRPASPRRRPGR